MRIERGAEGDLAEVLALEREVAEAPHWGEAVYRELLRGEGTALRGWRVLVARGEGGAVEGFAVATLVRAAGVAELENIAVAAGARRQGVGRALCGAAVMWAREEGAQTVELEVWEGNGAAVALYEGVGFQAVGWRPHYYGAGRHARRMRLELQRTGPRPL